MSKGKDRRRAASWKSEAPAEASRGYMRSTCATCGKQGWWTRKDAKNEARRLGGEHLHTYWCDDAVTGKRLYHVGHMAPGKPRELYRVKAGREAG